MSGSQRRLWVGMGPVRRRTRWRLRSVARPRGGPAGAREGGRARGVLAACYIETVCVQYTLQTEPKARSSPVVQVRKPAGPWLVEDTARAGEALGEDAGTREDGRRDPGERGTDWAEGG